MARRYLGVQRTPVADSAYTAIVTDRTIAITSITASRVITLPPAASFLTGTPLLIIDESGSLSPTVTVTVSPASGDTIVGGILPLNTPYAYLAIESNGTSKWTIDKQFDGVVYGPGQATNAFNPTGTLGGSLTLRDTGGAVNNGGVILFGALQGVFGAIKGLLNGGVGPIGSIDFEMRTAGANTTFTTVVTINSAGLLTAKVGLTVTGGPLTLPTSTVANLPAGTVGQMYFCTNARMFNGAGVQEASGSGTGGIVSYNGTAWKIDGTNVTVTA